MVKKIRHRYVSPARNGEEGEEEGIEYKYGPYAAKMVNQRSLTIVILLIIVFTLGLGNSLAILRADDEGVNNDRLDDEAYVTISGRVIDKNTGDNIDGVLILIKGTNLSDTTNVDGWFTIKNVRTGDQEVRAVKNGYTTVTKKVRLTPESLSKIDFEMISGAGEVEEEILFEDAKADDNGMKGPVAGLFMLFSTFAIIAILLVIYKKYFWLASFCIVISLLSYGFLFGTIFGIVALVLTFSIKDDFKSRKFHTEPVRAAKPAPRYLSTTPPTSGSTLTARKVHISRRYSRPPPPPPPPPSAGRPYRRIPPPPPPPPRDDDYEFSTDSAPDRRKRQVRPRGQWGLK